MTDEINQCWAYTISTLRNCTNSTGLGIQLRDGCLACARSWLDLMPSTTEKTKQNKIGKHNLINCSIMSTPGYF